MPSFLLILATQQLPPEGRALALSTILLVIFIALLGLGAIIALRRALLPPPPKPTHNAPPEPDASAWKIAAERIEPLPSPGANDETRGLGDGHSAIDPDDEPYS